MSDSTIIQLNKLLALLPDIIKDVEYSELYGYNLNTLPDTPAGTVIRDRLLTKFLVANKFVVSEAASQLKKTLAWRRDFNPLSAAFSETHNPEFEKLSITTSVPIPQAHVAPIKTASSAVTKTATTSDVAADVDAAKKKSNELEVPAAPAVEEHTSTVSEEATKPIAEASKPASDPVAEAEETAETSTEPVAEITEANAEPVAESTEAVSDVNETTEATETNDNTTTAEALVNENPESAPQLVMTWNLYGAVKNRKQLFSDLEGFLRWRVGIMERSIALLDFSSIETSYIVQLHDYHNVSFLFLDSPTKAASKATIELFQNYYPEFLNVKYFVNIPIVMSWLYSFVKLLVSKETSDKFRVIANGADLAATAGNWVPKKYGGIADGFDEIAVKQIEPIDATLIDAPRPEKKVKPATKTDSTAEAAETAEASEPTEASKSADDAKVTNADESASKANIAEDAETAPKTDITEVTDAKAEPKVATVSSTNEPTTTTTAASATVPDSPTETTATKVVEHKTAEPAVVSEPPTDTVVTTAADANGINVEAAAPPAPMPGNDTLDDTAAKPTAA